MIKKAYILIGFAFLYCALGLVFLAECHRALSITYTLFSFASVLLADFAAHRHQSVTHARNKYKAYKFTRQA